MRDVDPVRAIELLREFREAERRWNDARLGGVVSIERVFYCDWRECERHVQTARSRPEPFITVTEGAGRSQHFCGWDCLLKHAAERPPAEIIPAGD